MIFQKKPISQPVGAPKQKREREYGSMGSLRGASGCVFGVGGAFGCVFR